MWSFRTAGGVGHVGLMSRARRGLTDEATLRRVANDQPLFLGILWLDHPASTPNLEPDLYTICWRGPTKPDQPNALPDHLILESVNGRDRIRGTVSWQIRSLADAATRVEAIPDRNQLELHLALPARPGKPCLVISFNPESRRA